MLGTNDHQSITVMDGYSEIGDLRMEFSTNCSLGPFQLVIADNNIA